MTATELVALVEAVAWPICALIAVLLLRAQLPSLLGRTKKVGAFGFEVEFHEAAEFAPTWSIPSLGDVRRAAAADEFSSYAECLMEEFRCEGAYDYAVVNLGEGRSWLTSRLYIFSIMLQRMRGLRCWVFLRPEGSRRIYLGIATPGEVRWALARKFPWLEQAYTNACAEQSYSEIKSNQGALEPVVAKLVVQAFLTGIQTDDESLASPEDEWERVDGNGLWERAEWISSESVSATLGSALRTSAVSGDLKALGTEQRRAVLRAQGDFVALYGEGWTFNGLVDRRATLDGLSTSLTNAADTAAQ